MISGNLLPIATLIDLNLYASEVWKPVTKIPGAALDMTLIIELYCEIMKVSIP